MRKGGKLPSALHNPETGAHWPVETLILAGFFSILLLLAGMGWLSFRSTVEMKRAVVFVDHTHDLIEMLRELELDVREAEAALRTYMLTDDALWLAEYRKQAFNEMNEHLAGARRLSAGNGDQLKRLDRIEVLIRTRVAHFEETRKAHETKPDDKAGETRRMRAGAELTQQLVALFDDFVSRENHLVNARVDERESHARLVMQMIIASGASAFAFVSVALFMIFRSLRSRRDAEERLKVSLGEKEILLKEVHHRVKNNLQVISSLLSLEAEKLTNPQAITVFKECRDRIHLMARLHQQLYSKGQYALVDFGEHLREMTQMLVRSHAPAGCDITLEAQVSSMVVDLDMAVTLGLIANEVILNSLKHAFSGRQSGTMGVELNDGSQRVMVVYDDGNGLPDGFDPKKATGLGLELVLGLSRQIHGEASIANRPSGGSCTTIRFPATSAGTQTETQIPKAQTPCPPNASSLSKTKPSPQSPSSVS